MRLAEPGAALNHAGDLDNRLKTLFDALRIPKPTELSPDDYPRDDEIPFYVLLKDDALVTSFSVTTDRLLKPAPADEVELIIHVRVHAILVSMANIGIAG